MYQVTFGVYIALIFITLIAIACAYMSKSEKIQAIGYYTTVAISACVFVLGLISKPTPNQLQIVCSILLFAIGPMSLSVWKGNKTIDSNHLLATHMATASATVGWFYMLFRL